MAAKAIKPSRLDRVLMALAPGWGLRRMQARVMATAMARHYDAASSGRRTDGWHRRSTDANAAAAASRVRLRELSRDLRRNNGWAHRGIQVIGNNTVGWGIEAKASGVTPEIESRAIEIWNDWSRTASCDYDGRLPFAGIQRLVMDTVVESGEALVVRERSGERDGLPVPVRLRVLEPDYLDTNRDGVSGESGPIIQGVETDGRGRRVAYWLYDSHPGATGISALSRSGSVSRRVPAEDVIHVFHVDRPEQMRGVPWLAIAVVKLQDFDDYDDAVLMQQKIAACFGAFVQDFDGMASPLGEPDSADDRIETLEPGHIEYLPPGKTVTFATPPPVTDHGSFTQTNLRRIAASLGVTYEDLTGDYSQVNFSSARMGRIAHWANVHDWRWNMLVPQLCDGVWSWVMSMAADLEGWPAVPRAEWAPPPMPMLEPDKEGMANNRLIRSGTRTLYQIIRENGEDPEAHLAEIAAGNAKLDELGIVLDSDARRTSGAGQAQPDQDDESVDSDGASGDDADES